MIFLFCSRKALQITSGVDDMGEMVWPLFGLLVFAWICTYFAIWKGVKVTGKIMYFTGKYPYVSAFNDQFWQGSGRLVW